MCVGAASAALEKSTAEPPYPIPSSSLRVLFFPDQKALARLQPSEPSSVASSSMGSELGWDPWACIGSSASACFLEPVFFLTAGHFLPYDRSDTSKIAESFSVRLRCPGAEWKSGPATSTYSTALVHRNDVLFLEEDSEAVVIVLCKSDLPQNIKPFPFPLSDPKQDEEQFLQGLCGLRVLLVGGSKPPSCYITPRGAVDRVGVGLGQPNRMDLGWPEGEPVDTNEAGEETRAKWQLGKDFRQAPRVVCTYCSHTGLSGSGVFNGSGEQFLGVHLGRWTHPEDELASRYTKMCPVSQFEKAIKERQKNDPMYRFGGPSMKLRGDRKMIEQEIRQQQAASEQMQSQLPHWMEFLNSFVPSWLHPFHTVPEDFTATQTQGEP